MENEYKNSWPSYMFGWTNKEINRMNEVNKQFFQPYNLDFMPVFPKVLQTVIEEEDKEGNKKITTITDTVKEVIEYKKDGGKITTKTFFQTDFDFYKPLYFK